MIRNVMRSARSHYLLSVAVAAILPGLIATAVEYYLTEGVSGISSILAALAGGVGTFVILAFVEPARQIEPTARSQASENGDSTSVSQSTQLPTLQASANALVKGRSYTRRTPMELVAEFDGRTEIVAKELTKRHLGQWLRVQGRVRNISPFMDDLIVVYLDQKPPEPQLALYFEEGVWRSRLNVLDKGDEVVVDGKIEDISERAVRLEDCVLIE